MRIFLILAVPPFFGPRDHHQNREFSYNANLGLFSEILGTLCTLFMFLTCLITKNEENIGILINFIDDVIVTSSPWIFKVFF